jgi:hypothetical protein
MKSKSTKIYLSQSAESKGTSRAVVSMWGNASMRAGPTAAASAQWMGECRLAGRNVIREKNALDKKVADLISRLYFDAKCGHAGLSITLRGPV